jgi:hypothetical protein
MKNPRLANKLHEDAAKVRDSVDLWTTPSRRAEEINPILGS